MALFLRPSSLGNHRRGTWFLKNGIGNRPANTPAMVALLREQLADMRQQRDHWQNEAADWKRQAQNLLPPPQPAPQQAATSEKPSATGPATEGNRLKRTWRWLRASG
jgi:hypothetical protein